MSFRIVDAASLEPGPGPHPAASPFDKRVSESLGLRNFEVYQVELPPGEQTVVHDHVEDGVEDLYAVVRGSGWVVVDGGETAIRPGHFVAVSMESSRSVTAGPEGLVLIAVCA